MLRGGLAQWNQSLIFTRNVIVFRLTILATRRSLTTNTTSATSSGCCYAGRQSIITAAVKLLLIGRWRWRHGCPSFVRTSRGWGYSWPTFVGWALGFGSLFLAARGRPLLVALLLLGLKIKPWFYHSGNNLSPKLPVNVSPLVHTIPCIVIR